jgi:hypothetical protein
MPVETAQFGVLSLIGLLLFIGATGKSAQIPLYVWLPDAMEGPTPVSALIHAATMVTAGVYMVARSNAIFNRAPEALAVVAVNGKQQSGVKPGTFHIVERTWRKGDKVELTFPMRVRAGRWYHGSVALERGPLVYSLRIGEDWRKIAQHGPAADWEVLPTTAWNYGLVLDPADPGRSVAVTEKPVGESPFSPESAPVELRVKARRLPQWALENGSAGPLPESPAASSEKIEDVVLIPYGSAKLRITAFPLLKQ